MTEIALRDNAAIEHHGPAAGALALRADQQQWTDQQRAALAQIGVDRAGPGDLAVFMHVSQRTGLDPFSRQIYFIQRGGKWTIQTGIDGFRVIASRNHEYGGQVGPQWCGEDGVWRDFWFGNKPPVAARVGIVRHGWTEPVWGIALHAEFTAGNSMWKDKPAHMTAKCAEALALRKAFPHDLAGLVTDDEMGRADRRPAAAPTVRATAVTADELTGAASAPAAQPAAPPSAGDGGRMSQEQQARLLGAMRESDVDDRWGWASGVLGRDVTSYGQLSDADADRLIADLSHDGAANGEAGA